MNVNLSDLCVILSAKVTEDSSKSIWNLIQFHTMSNELIFDVIKIVSPPTGGKEENRVTTLHLFSQVFIYLVKFLTL